MFAKTNEWNGNNVFAGVAVGGGWQALVAYINLFCYYIVGLPLGFFLGYKANFGVEVYFLIQKKFNNLKILKAGILFTTKKFH